MIPLVCLLFLVFYAKFLVLLIPGAVDTNSHILRPEQRAKSFTDSMEALKNIIRR